jgi:NAD(P)-dependent dehydrogenase (short-subunit alcohol dehydrogenase family)
MDKTYIVMTGATSGLGLAAAIKIAEDGKNLIILARNKALFEAFNNTVSTRESGEIIFIECDLSSLKSVQNAIHQIQNENYALEMLINNAGIWSFKRELSEDGIEKTLQVNVLAPYLLMYHLGPILSSNPEHKIINTVSALHQGNIQFDDIEFNSKYNSFMAYRQSKLALILLSRLLSSKKAFHIYLMHPGLVDTNLPSGGGVFANWFFKLFGKSPKNGAKTLLFLYKTPVHALLPGSYYKNERQSMTSTPASNDMEVARKLDEIVKGYLELK